LADDTWHRADEAAWRLGDLSLPPEGSILKSRSPPKYYQVADVRSSWNGMVAILDLIHWDWEQRVTILRRGVVHLMEPRLRFYDVLRYGFGQ